MNGTNSTCIEVHRPIDDTTTRPAALFRAPSLAMLVLTALIWPSSTTADEIPKVVVDTDASSCSEEVTEQLLGELQLRTSTKMLSPTEADGEPHRLSLRSADDQSRCEMRLKNDEKHWTLTVDKDATRPQIASTANRMAWILDGIDVPAPDSAVEDDRRIDDPVDSTHPQATTDEPSKRLFSLDAVGGAMWIPAAQEVVPMTRVRTSWSPRSKLRFGLTGRLPVRPLVASDEQTTHSYRPWAVNITAGYDRELRERWSLRADGGLQRTFPSLNTYSSTDSTDDPPSTQLTSEGNHRQNSADASEDWREDDNHGHQNDEAPDEPPGQLTNTRDASTPEALVPWAAVTHASLRYALTRDVALHLDTGFAISVSERQIRDETGVVIPLGRLEIDLLVGLDLRF